MTTDTTAAPPPTLAGSLALVQSQLPRITKDKTAEVRSDKGSYSYSYADLAAVTAEILPLLGRCGLAWVTRPTFNGDGKFILAYQLLHASGDSITGEYPLPNAGTPQAMGSAITYARRYTLCSVTGVAPDTDDDDAAQAMVQSRGTRTVQRKRQDREPADQGPARAVQRRQAAQDGPPLPGERAARDAVTEPQLRKLGAVFTDLGVRGPGERTQRLRIASDVVGRTLASSRELTKREAQTLIDTLESGDGARLVAKVQDAAPEPPAGDRPDPWGINDPTGGADPDTDPDASDQLPVPGDDS